MPKQHIFLLSHMRAYTSLFGHIMGSNPAICGYYEMHIGYHSWKSLIRQKMLYFEQEKPKPGYTFMFDKILHNDHDIALEILNSQRSRAIFSLRSPEAAIPSILALYGRINPTHEFNNGKFASQYYIARLEMLESIALGMQQDFFYMDAEALKQEPDQCLASLSEWLGLKTPLSPTYTLQNKTSHERYGDSSERISSGQIAKDSPDYSQIHIDDGLMQLAMTTHERIRTTLIGNSSQRATSHFGKATTTP